MVRGVRMFVAFVRLALNYIFTQKEKQQIIFCQEMYIFKNLYTI